MKLEMKHVCLAIIHLSNKKYFFCILTEMVTNQLPSLLKYDEKALNKKRELGFVGDLLFSFFFMDICF